MESEVDDGPMGLLWVKYISRIHLGNGILEIIKGMHIESSGEKVWDDVEGRCIDATLE